MRRHKPKRVYDTESGRYVRKDIHGEGIWDITKNIGRKASEKLLKKLQKRLEERSWKRLGILTRKKTEGAERSVESKTKVSHYPETKGENGGDKIVEYLQKHPINTPPLKDWQNIAGNQ